MESAFVQNYAIARWNFADLGNLLELFTRYLQFRNAIYVMNLFQSPNLFPLIWNYDRARACKCILKFAVFYASDLFRDTIIRRLRLQTCHGDFLWLTFCNSVHLVSCSFQNTFFRVLCIRAIIMVRDCWHSTWSVSVMTLTIRSDILWWFIHFWWRLPLIRWNNF